MSKTETNLSLNICMLLLQSKSFDVIKRGDLQQSIILNWC